MGFQLARLSRLVISRREKKRLRVPNLRQKNSGIRQVSLNLQKPLSLARCLPWAQRTFHVFLSPLPFALSLIFLVVIPLLAIIPPSSDHFTPQIFPIYLRVLRCVLHFAKPGECLLQTTEHAKVKPVFKLCSGFQSSSIWRVPTNVVGPEAPRSSTRGKFVSCCSTCFPLVFDLMHFGVVVLITC